MCFFANKKQQKTNPITSYSARLTMTNTIELGFYCAISNSRIPYTGPIEENKNHILTVILLPLGRV